MANPRRAPKSSDAAAARPPSPPRAPSLRLLVLAAAFLLSVANPPNGGRPKPLALGAPLCGASPFPDDALLLLNNARRLGAACHAGAERSFAEPLRLSAALMAAASAQASDMAAVGHMSHLDNQGQALGARLRAAGYAFGGARENVAAGQPSLEEAIEDWLASEGHCDNLLAKEATEAGVACADGASGRYWALELGTPPRAR